MKSNLSPWASEAVEHWRKYRPKMYAKLFANGELYDWAEKAAEQTRKEYYAGIMNGLLPHESWEAVRQNHMFLPAEEDVPHLGESQVSSQDPINLATTTVSPPKTTSGKAARKQKYAYNVEAIRILKDLESTGRAARPVKVS